MRKVKKGLLAGLVAVSITAFGTIGCSAINVDLPNAKTLESVSQSSIVASLQGSWLTVEWGAVEHATSYWVNYEDTTLTVLAPETRAVFPDVEYVSGSVTVAIVARAFGYNDSVATTYTFTPDVIQQPPQTLTLAVPTGLSVASGILSWNSVPNATSYTVSDGSNSAMVNNSTSIDLAAYGLTVPTSGSVTYTVVAKATGYKDSTAAQYTYTAGAQTLAKPTGLAVASGILSWGAVNNATSYTVSDGIKSVTVNVTSVNLALNGLTVPTNGSVTYTVTAKAAGYNDSSESLTYTVTPPPQTKLDAPTGFNFENGVLSWEAVKNATSYTVTDGTKTVTVSTNSVNLASNFTLTEGETKQFSIVAKGAGYDDSVSATYNYTDEHRHTFNMSKWENNKTHHWHDITCGHEIATEYMNGYAVHDFGSGNTCSVCMYSRVSPIVGAYVYYGEYPQTLKADNVTLGATADGNGYYTGSDGAKYAKVTAAPAERFPGDQIVFGNDERIVTGTDYFFKVEPIKWRILEQSNGSSLLLTDQIIGYSAYYSSEAERTIGGSTVYASNYANSDIRTWLNGTFYNVAFSSGQQQGIQITTVDNSAATTSLSTNTYVCENTQDKVFLLANREVRDTSWGFLSDNTENDPMRLLVVSDYARACGVYARNEVAWRGCGAWWLRSPMHDSAITADCGGANGWVASSKVTSTSTGVAPAMRVTTTALA